MKPLDGADLMLAAAKVSAAQRLTAAGHDVLAHCEIVAAFRALAQAAGVQHRGVEHIIAIVETARTGGKSEYSLAQERGEIIEEAS